MSFVTDNDFYAVVLRYSGFCPMCLSAPLMIFTLLFCGTVVLAPDFLGTINDFYTVVLLHNGFCPRCLLALLLIFTLLFRDTVFFALGIFGQY